MTKHLLPFLSLLLFVSCTAHIDPNTMKAKQKSLYSLLLKNNTKINHHEAHILAQEAVKYSRNLASKYKVTTPALIHNFLVNIKAKDRGLCYQWSDDLYLYLKKYHFKTLHLRPVGANIGEYWSEHNALVVLPSGSNDLKHGVLLDPWRESGNLYFSHILKDPEYRWRIRTDRCEIY